MTPPQALPQQILRIIDANLNRASEGLRVLEDVARLVLNDAAISEQLKTMRHRLVEGDLAINKQLIGARDAEGDVGINLKAPGIEELARSAEISPKLDSESFKQARFELYSIEQKLLSLLLRQDKAKRIGGLCAIIDTQALKGRRHPEVTGQVIRGGNYAPGTTCSLSSMTTWTSL